MAGARPAEPLLARALVGDEELERLLEGVLSGKGVLEEEDAKLSTGSRSVDEALEGGLEGGNVVGLWSEGGGGAEVRAIHLARYYPRRYL